MKRRRRGGREGVKEERGEEGGGSKFSVLLKVQVVAELVLQVHAVLQVKGAGGEKWQEDGGEENEGVVEGAGEDECWCSRCMRCCVRREALWAPHGRDGAGRGMTGGGHMSV